MGFIPPPTTLLISRPPPRRSERAEVTDEEIEEQIREALRNRRTSIVKLLLPWRTGR